jgi:hypothetical protein
MVFLFMQTNSNGAETDNGSSDTLPNSKKVYVAGKQHVDLRVPSFVMSSGVETSLTISLII